MLRKLLLFIALLGPLSGCGVDDKSSQQETSHASPDDIAWEVKGDASTVITFERRQVVLEGPDEKVVWDVVEGNHPVTGLKLRRKGDIVEAKGIQKFNEMIFTLGDKTWVLRRKGSENPTFPEGMEPNQPPPLD